MKKHSIGERVAFSPGEFAEMFGKSQTWGYRQIYAGKIKAITEFGRIQIPASEVERVLETAGVYEGLPQKVARTKSEIQELRPKMGGAWQTYLERRRESGDQKESVASKSQSGPDSRAGALGRLVRSSTKVRHV